MLYPQTDTAKAVVFLGLFFPAFSFSLHCHNVFRLIGQAHRKVAPFLTTEASPVFHFQHEKTYVKKALRLSQDLVNPVLRGTATIGIFPKILSWLPAPTRSIFIKQWVRGGWDPYEPSADEIEVLKKYRAYDLFSERKDFLANHPRWAFVHRSAERAAVSTARGIYAAVYVAALNNLYHQWFSPHGQLDANGYLINPDLRPQDEEIQLLIESVPYPHLAIRIGDRVFSYGQQHLLVMPASAYIYEKSIRRFMELNANRKNDKDSILAKLDDLPRTIEVITLKLGKRRRNEIKRHLEMQVSKQYKNEWFVNNCSVMTMRALGMENQLFDVSPSGIALYFAGRKTSGDPLVGKIFQVSPEKPTESKKQLLRNFYIHFLDAIANVYLAPSAQIDRIQFDRSHRPDQIQFYNPEIQAHVDFLKIEARDRFQKNEELLLYRQFVNDFAKMQSTDPDKLPIGQRLRRVIEVYFDSLEKKARETYADPESKLPSLIESQTQLEILPSIKEELLREVP